MRLLPILMLMAACAVGAEPDAARMDAVVASRVEADQFSGSVLVQRGQETIFAKSVGWANAEHDVPNRAETKFRIGSITKQFTAAAVLLLEEDGKLRVQDPVSVHVADAPEAWKGIRIHHLLSHTSGIPSFTSFPEYRELKLTEMSAADIVKVFRDKPLEFEPGTRFQYSNSGYLLLGFLVEKISGQSYEELLRSRIFGPLEMKNSGYDHNRAIVTHRAAGYTRGPDGNPQNADYINMSVPHAAGGLYSTTTDLCRWVRGLFGGEVLSDASLKKMITANLESYGYGLVTGKSSGHTFVAHGGGIEGFNTDLRYFPDEQMCVTVLSNVNTSATGAMADELAKLAFGEQVTLHSERKEIPLDSETLAKYAGVYQSDGGPTMTITLEDAGLMSRLGNQPKLQIYPESKTTFFPKEVAAELVFSIDVAGNATGFVLRQAGRERQFMRGPEK
ncbi:MAG: serine hydrolase [Luteitalea sp.]|nr:serine hydrolase [Luteitalea sp.]